MRTNAQVLYRNLHFDGLLDPGSRVALMVSCRKGRYMRAICMASAVMAFATALVADPCFSKETHSRKVLKKWDGSWKHRTVVRPAAWSLVGTEISGTSTAQWILKDHYQQVTGQSGDWQTREIHRFDADSGQYHKWVFDSDGGHSFWVGAWDGESEAMTWKYMDFGQGIRGNIVNRFSGDAKYETTLIMKDSQGNLLLDIRSQHTRICGSPNR